MLRSLAFPLVLSLAAALVLGVAACVPDKPLPGDQFIGAYTFSAVRVRSTDECPSSPDAGFDADLQQLDFNGSISRCTAPGATSACLDGGETFFTVNDVDRAATFDGQRILVSPTEVPRTFPACVNGQDSCAAVGNEPGSRLREDLDLVLYSSSQWAAAGRACDGGQPIVDPDAGILPPGVTQEGFDAVVVCGALNERILAPPRCVCVPEKIPETGCTMVYALTAVRK